MESQQLICLSLSNQERAVVVTDWSVSLREPFGKSLETGILCSLNRFTSTLFVSAVQGVVKVVQLSALDSSVLSKSSGSVQSAASQVIFTLRLMEFRLLCLTAFQGPDNRLAVLSVKNRSENCIKTYRWVCDKLTPSAGAGSPSSQFENGPFTVTDLDASTDLMISVPDPHEGLLIISAGGVRFVNGRNAFIRRSFSKPTLIKALDMVDSEGLLYLLGSHEGELFSLQLVPTLSPTPTAASSTSSALVMDPSRVEEIRLNSLGFVSIPSCIRYLNDRMAFVGSHFGDSLLVQLPESFSEQLVVMDRIPNLAPIIDFQVVEDQDGIKSQLVTCSGGFKDGSLRVVRNGVGITVVGSMTIPGIQHVWPLRSFNSSSLVVMSTLQQTTLLRFQSFDDVEQVHLPSFSPEPTVVACNTNDGSYLQITQSGIRVIRAKQFSEVCIWNWECPLSATILIASYSNDLAIMVASSKEIWGVRFSSNKEPVKIFALPITGDVSCLTSFVLNGKCIMAYGSWDKSVRMVEVPSLRSVLATPLKFDSVPRSIAFATFCSTENLFVAIGDGKLAYGPISFDGVSLLAALKVIRLAVRPITLSSTTLSGQSVLLACAETVTIIHADSRIRFASSTTSAISFSSVEMAQQGVLWATEQELYVGLLDDIQNLQIQSMHLGEQPRRIATQKETRTLGVITSRMVPTAAREEVEKDRLRLLDYQTFEDLDSYDLQPYERAQSIESVHFMESCDHVYLVGTGFVYERESGEGSTLEADDELDAKEGRILAFSVRSQKAILLNATAVKGTVFCIRGMVGRRVVAGINSKVVLFSWVEGESGNSRSLVPLFSYSNNVMALYMEIRNRMVVIGDLMKSMNVLRLSDDDNHLVEQGRESNVHWMTAVDAIDEETFLGAEHNFGVFTESLTTTSVHTGKVLEMSACMNVGSFVNRFRKAWVFDEDLEKSNAGNIQPIMYGTVSGSIGILFPLKESDFELLKPLQSSLQRFIQGVGGLSHAEYRALRCRRESLPMTGFIDGDLVETFLDMTGNQRQLVFEAAEPPIDVGQMEATLELLERLSRLH